MRELLGATYTKEDLSMLLLLAEFRLTFLLVLEVAYYFSREMKQTGRKEI